MLFMFLRFFSIFIFYPTRLKEINPDSTEDSIPDSNLHFPDFFPMFSRFPKFFLQNQHFAAKLLFLIFICLFVVFFFLSLLLSLCFPVVFILFIFVFLICFLFSVVFSDCFFEVFFRFFLDFGVL